MSSNIGFPTSDAEVLDFGFGDVYFTSFLALDCILHLHFLVGIRNRGFSISLHFFDDGFSKGCADAGAVLSAVGLL